jgi:hypothetical protein
VRAYATDENIGCAVRDGRAIGGRDGVESTRRIRREE